MSHYVAPRRVLFFAGLFLLLFFIIGMVDVIRSMKPLTWDAAPCSIEEFEVIHDPGSKPPFGAQLTFQFEWAGQTHRASTLGIPGWPDYRQAWEFEARLEEAGEVMCYLPDADPSRACLVRPPFRGSGFAFIMFAVCLGWILFMADRYRSSPTKKMTQAVALPGGLFFGLPGVFMLAAFSLPTWSEMLAVGSWSEVPATIEEVTSHQVEREGTPPGRIVHVDIIYTYSYAGRVWRQNRYRPGALDQSTEGGMQALAKDFLPGSTTTCWVNPEKPWESVLINTLGWSWLFTLFPLPFLAIGICFLVIKIRGCRRE